MRNTTLIFVLHFTICVCVCACAFASVCAFLIANALQWSLEDNLEEIGPLIPQCGFYGLLSSTFVKSDHQSKITYF